jgi:type I restriction enzyme S subunit
MITGVDCTIIRPNENLLSEFLCYYQQSNDYLNDVLKGVSGATRQRISRKNLGLIEIPLPPLQEQQRIVAIIDEAFTAIDKAKANTEQNLKNAKELFESELQRVFSNSNWEEKMLKEIGNAQTGTTPKTAEKDNYGNYIPFIKPADVDYQNDGSIRYNNEGLTEKGLKSTRLMSKGSVLMVCIGATIGKVGFVDRDVTSNQQINSLTVSKDFYPKFFYYALSTKNFYNNVIKSSAQATLPIINKGKWENLSVKFPKSIKDQQTIVSKLDTLREQTKKLEAVYEKKLQDLDELKKSVLSKAFSGELLKTEIIKV